MLKPNNLFDRTRSIRSTKAKADMKRRDSAQIQAAIQRYSSACGCELGSLFMLGATVAFLAHLRFGVDHWSTAGTWWRGCLWVLSWGVVGKLLGLSYARIRLHMLRSAQREG